MMIDSFLSVKPFDRTDFSVLTSLKEAFAQTLTSNYFKVVRVWLLLCIMAAIFLPQSSAMFVTYIAGMGVAVAWFRFLGYGEEIPLIRFGKKELRYLWWTLVASMVVVLVIVFPLVILIGIVSFFDNGNGAVVSLATSGAVAVLGTFFLYFIPYMHLYFGLLALGFRGHLHKVKEIVRPMGFSMWGVYIAITLLPMVIGIAISIVSGRPFGAPQGVIQPIGVVLGFLIGGVTATFTSHIIYIRASYKKPDGDDGEAKGSQ